MEFENFSSIALPEIEANLQQMLIKYIPINYPELREMLAYHMGWESLDDVKNRGGKGSAPYWYCCVPMQLGEIGARLYRQQVQLNISTISRSSMTIFRTTVSSGGERKRSGSSGGLRRRSMLVI